MWGYNISEASQYLVLTGAGIDDVRIVKKAFVFPWQKIARISVAPFDFALNLQAMTVSFNVLSSSSRRIRSPGTRSSLQTPSNLAELMRALD